MHTVCKHLRFHYQLINHTCVFIILVICCNPVLSMMIKASIDKTLLSVFLPSDSPIYTHTSKTCQPSVENVVYLPPPGCVLVLLSFCLLSIFFFLTSLADSKANIHVTRDMFTTSSLAHFTIISSLKMFGFNVSYNNMLHHFTLIQMQFLYYVCSSNNRINRLFFFSANH